MEAKAEPSSWIVFYKKPAEGDEAPIVTLPSFSYAETNSFTIVSRRWFGTDPQTTSRHSGVSSTVAPASASSSSSSGQVVNAADTNGILAPEVFMYEDPKEPNESSQPLPYANTHPTVRDLDLAETQLPNSALVSAENPADTRHSNAGPSGGIFMNPYIKGKILKPRLHPDIPNSLRSHIYHAGNHQQPIPYPERLDPSVTLILGDIYIRDLPPVEGRRTIQLWMYNKNEDGELEWRVIRDLDTDVSHPSQSTLKLFFTQAGAPHWIRPGTKRRTTRIAQPMCWVPSACPYPSLRTSARGVAAEVDRIEGSLVNDFRCVLYASPPFGLGLVFVYDSGRENQQGAT
ncbi:hypothetical protein QCA50_019424 [Cerrena zonata]|uniref:Uncharacterized protein n=1 Tax=Cerrena zonata TaxID=2478898 RepID=A0AAW0FJ24_9APHY